MNKKWLAMWKGPYDGSAYKTVDILVEVCHILIPFQKKTPTDITDGRQECKPPPAS